MNASLRFPRSRTASLIGFVALVAGGSHLQAQLPAVGSGSLVAHFKATPESLTLDISNSVLSWAALNNPSLVLNTFGSTPGNILYDATGMNGSPTIRVNDFSVDNQVLRGAIPGTRTATTIFWLGYYSPGRDGSTGDSAGQYAFSYGADGTDGSQMDNQIDNGLVQLFGGNATQSGSNISALNGTYTVWNSFFGEGSGNGHRVNANGTDLGVTTPNGGNYSVTGDLQLFGYQNSSGTSGGFNFVGNMSEFIIYDGILNPTDANAVRSYMLAQVPEPSSVALLSLAGGFLLGRRRSSTGRR